MAQLLARYPSAISIIIVAMMMTTSMRLGAKPKSMPKKQVKKPPEPTQQLTNLPCVRAFCERSALDDWEAEAMKTTQKSMGSQEEFKPSSQEEEEPNRRKPLPRPLPKPSPPSHEEEEPGFELTEELIDELIANPPHNDELIDEVNRHPLVHEEEEPKKSMMTKRRSHEPSSDEEKEPKRRKLLPRHNEEQKLKSDALDQDHRVATRCSERSVEEFRVALKWKSIPLRLRHLDSPQCSKFGYAITKSDAGPSRMPGGMKLNNFQSEVLRTLRRLQDGLSDLLEQGK